MSKLGLPFHRMVVPAASALSAIMLSLTSGAADAKMKIYSVTPIYDAQNQYIVIQGTGFGTTPPQTYSLGDGSVDTVDCHTLTPSMAITDSGGGTDNWSAGRMTCTNTDAIGIVPNSNADPSFWWNDNLIVLWGFGSAFSGLMAGDPLEVRLSGGANRPNANFKLKASPMTPPHRKGETDVTVQGNQGLTDTGIAVQAGQYVSIKSGGLVTFAADGRPPISPAGFPPNCYTYAPGGSGFPAPQLPCESLIGQIGSGDIFEVGPNQAFTAPVSGDLYLGVNDNQLDDNSGSWTASVVITN